MGIPWYKKLDNLLLLLILSALSVFLYRYTISYFPSHIHAWTQSDRLALALGFLDNGFNFFKPQTYNLTTLHGITGVDFPIHEYLVALIMKIVGTESPAVFRIYTLIYSITGLFFLFHMTRAFIGPLLLRIAVIVFVFTCPVITYYQSGFLPSSTSFATVLIGYFFYFKFLKNKNTKHFYFAIGFICLAALCRSPFNIFLFGILLHEVIRAVKIKKVYTFQLLSFTAAYILIFLFYWYKTYLNATYGSQFLVEILPAQSMKEFIDILSSVFERWTFQLFTLYHYFLLMIAIVFVIVNGRKVFRLDGLKKELLLQSIIILVGAAVYFVIMAKQFVDHEYYFIDSFYPGIILIFILGISLIRFDSRTSVVAYSILIPMLLVGATIESDKVQKLKYAETLWDRGEVTRKNFIGSADFLDGLGVLRTDTILVIDAYSTNAPLILMDRKGYTGLRTAAKEIEKLLQLNYNYLVIQDIFFPSEVVYGYPEILRQLERVGGNGKLSVFKRIEGDTIQSIHYLLGILEPPLTRYNTFESESNNPLWKTEGELSDIEYVSPPYSSFIDSSVVYGPGFELNQNSMSFNKILFEGNFKIKENMDKVYVVCSITDDDEDIYYWNFPIKNIGIDVWRNYQCLFALPFTPEPDHILKCYIWNPEKENIFVDDIKLTLYQN